MATIEALRAALLALAHHWHEGAGWVVDPESPTMFAPNLAVAEIAMLSAALDELAILRARITALQTALAQTTSTDLHRVADRTGYAIWYCRYCGKGTFDSDAPRHHAGCPVQVLADSYREE